MSKISTLRSHLSFRRHLTKRRSLFAVAAVATLTFSALLTQYFLPAKITLSYAAAASCASRMTLLPSVLKQTQTAAGYTLSHHGGLSVGSVALFSTALCAEPTEQPHGQTTRLALSPFGWPVLRSPVDVTPETPPAVVAIADEKIAISNPLSVTLSSPDVLHNYSVRIADNTAPCQSDHATTLNCNMSALGLAQGKSYPYTLERQFDDASATAVKEGTVDILVAVNIKKTSIRDKQTVYTTPRTITIATDKPLVDASATLRYKNGTTTTTVPVTSTVKNTTITITSAAALPREKDYTLELRHAQSVDGSQLEKPYKLRFHTSGGPKVERSSIGALNVSEGSTVSLTFDQPVKPAKLSTLITVNDKPVAVQATGATVSFALPQLGRCAAFTITVKKGVVGTKNNLKNTNSWSQTSRTRCGTSRVIGHSVQGRAIVAHYFGTAGGTTTLFTGGIHGEEQSGAQTMDAWVSYLQAHAQEIPTGKQIVVVPRVNPDGLAQNTRLNARGVNLARNFPTSDWQKSIVTSGASLPRGGGSSAGSEPETRALMNMSRGLRIKLALSYHAQGSLVGSNNYGSADNYASRYATTMGYRNMSHSAEAIMGYEITGEYEMWLAEQGTPAVLIELPTRYGSYLGSHQPLMWSIATE